MVTAIVESAWPRVWITEILGELEAQPHPRQAHPRQMRPVSD